MAGVMTLSPKNSAAPKTPSEVNTPVRTSTFAVARCTSAVRARIPPSPWLSARMTNARYLIETIREIAQKTSETTPYTSLGVGRTAPPFREKTIWSAYSGLVPISPKTTPSAPTISAATADRRTGRRARGGAVRRVSEGATALVVMPAASQPAE
jgi:hypothetical protein